MSSSVQIGVIGLIVGGLAVFGLNSFIFDQSAKPANGTSTTAGSNFNTWVGKAAPDFKLSSYDGTEYTLSALKGKKVVLFFNEGVMCYPGCWNQIAAFGTDPAFNTSDVVALSITVDTKAGWVQPMTRMPTLASAKILFDTSRTVSQQYGVMTLPSSMHRGSFPGHTYLVLDREGIVRYALDDPRMAIRNQEILAEVNKLN